MLKMDMAKAYDRFEWNFLHALLIKMGFKDVVVEWVMKHVSPVFFKNFLNGFPQSQFNPQMFEAR